MYNEGAGVSPFGVGMDALTFSEAIKVRISSKQDEAKAPDKHGVDEPQIFNN